VSDTLAIAGGTPAIAPGTIRPWPPIDDLDRRMVMDSLESGKHTFGPNCVAFQQEFAAWNGNRYAITTNSGTAALHMGLVAAECGCGDEVIVPAYTWSSSATCVMQHNAIPVFVDIDFSTMNIVARIEASSPEDQGDYRRAFAPGRNWTGARSPRSTG
jgi:dTDP-4-amino-4,6-dideoxygalactose transaminase